MCFHHKFSINGKSDLRSKVLFAHYYQKKSPLDVFDRFQFFIELVLFPNVIFYLTKTTSNILPSSSEEKEI